MNIRGQQHTIAYLNERESSLVNNDSTNGSLVTENRNRNLIGNSLNRPFVQPIDSMSVGLNSNFGKNLNKAGHSVSVSAHKANARMDANGALSSITDVNPLAALEMDNREPPRTVDRPKGIDKDAGKGVGPQAEIVRNREASNSQRSFRIRKYGRSISRISNNSKMSNRTHDDMNNDRRDPAQKTIEHTDVESNNDGPLDGGRSEFEHMNNSPDIKLRSIEIDDELTGRRLKKLAAPVNDTDSQYQEDDNSGTGHHVNSSQKMRTNQQLDAAVGLIQKMKQAFLNFKKDQQKIVG